MKGCAVDWILSEQNNEHPVAIHRRDGIFLVRVGASEFRARVLHHAAPRLTLLIDEQHIVDATVHWNGTDCSLVLDHVPYQFHLQSAADLATAHHGHSAQRIVAPLPGRIVDILVERGASVTAGQPVCIIEAMKMQNEICALTDGTVAEIAVTKGTAVEGNALLMVIE